MKSRPVSNNAASRPMPSQQRGVVLFFALIALVAMSLAAVALIRSVDTSTLISGNLAFKQSATSSGDSGLDLANVWLNATSVANNALNPTTDAAHTLNATDATSGYYSYVDDEPASANYVDIFANATWNAITAVAPTTDASGNTYQYIIQRVCRTPNALLSAADCLVSLDLSGGNSNVVKSSTSAGGSFTGISLGHPAYRVTIRTTGPKNTTSYIQAFVY